VDILAPEELKRFALPAEEAFETVRQLGVGERRASISDGSGERERFLLFQFRLCTGRQNWTSGHATRTWRLVVVRLFHFQQPIGSKKMLRHEDVRGPRATALELDSNAMAQQRKRRGMAYSPGKFTVSTENPDMAVFPDSRVCQHGGMSGGYLFQVGVYCSPATSLALATDLHEIRTQIKVFTFHSSPQTLSG
jgi:hypothetical protein